jgi:hypothetical protein
MSYFVDAHHEFDALKFELWKNENEKCKNKNFIKSS